LLSAGQTAAQTVQQTGDLTPGQTALALGSGALTGAIGAGGGALARRLGIADIDAALAGQVSPQSGAGLLSRTLAGLGSEGLEETAQSAQEQIAQNLSLGNPAMQGVGNAAAQGGVLGGLMGGATNIGGPSNATSQRPAAQPGNAAQPAQATGATNNNTMPTVDQYSEEVPIPFAGSADINPTLNTLGLDESQKAKAVELLRPSEASIEQARRGVVPLAEQQRLASLIGINAKDVARTRKVGEAWNAETMMAVTNATADKLAGVLELQQKIAAGNATDIEKALFISGAADYTAMSRSLLGATAEAGRALAAKRRSNYNLAEAQRVLEGVAGVSSAEEMAAALGKAVQAGGLQNAAKLMSDAKPGFFGYYLKAALLSNPATHVVNAISNAGMVANSVVERGIAAAISQAKGAVGLRKDTHWNEPIDQLYGLVTNLATGSKAALETFKTMDSPQLGAPGATEGQRFVPKGALEQTASVPFRLLSASDALFAQINYAMELRTLARNQTMAEKGQGLLGGKKVSTRINELVANPTPNMIESAGLHARDNTFNSRAGALVQGLNVAKQKLPWLNVIIPFLRTPANIIKSATRRTPFAPILQDVRADLAAGGKAQDQALARMAWGSSILVASGMLANAGYITGSGVGDDDKQKRARLATGWKPWSIKLNGEYVSYQRLDPFATLIGIGADLASMQWRKGDETAQGKAERLAKQAMGIVAANVTNKSFLQGATDFGEFMTNPERNAQWYVQKMGATLTQPISLLSGIAASSDPYMRETNSFADAWKYKVPGLRETLPVQIDQYGQPVRNVERSGPDLLNPVAESPVNNNPVRQALAQLGYAPPRIADHFTLAKQDVKLNAAQHNELEEIAGVAFYNLASNAVAKAGFNRADDDAKRDALDKLSNLARNTVKPAMANYVLTGDRRDLDALRAKLKLGKRP
jgi:hypothetical protein